MNADANHHICVAMFAGEDGRSGTLAAHHQSSPAVGTALLGLPSPSLSPHASAIGSMDAQGADRDPGYMGGLSFMPQMATIMEVRETHLTGRQTGAQLTAGQLGGALESQLNLFGDWEKALVSSTGRDKHGNTTSNASNVLGDSRSGSFSAYSSNPAGGADRASEGASNLKAGAGVRTNSRLRMGGVASTLGLHVVPEAPCSVDGEAKSTASGMASGTHPYPPSSALPSAAMSEGTSYAAVAGGGAGSNPGMSFQPDVRSSLGRDTSGLAGSLSVSGRAQRPASGPAVQMTDAGTHISKGTNASGAVLHATVSGLVAERGAAASGCGRDGVRPSGGSSSSGQERSSQAPAGQEQGTGKKSKMKLLKGKMGGDCIIS